MEPTIVAGCAAWKPHGITLPVSGGGKPVENRRRKENPASRIQIIEISLSE